MNALKYSLSSRQEAAYLKKADEIKVQWRDRRSIPDLAEKYPNATINLTRYYHDGVDNEIDWNEIKNYKILSKDQFVFGMTRPDEMLKAKEEGYKFYYLSALRTFQELNDMARLGVCRAQVAAPLFFQMDKVKKIGIPLYEIANQAHGDTIFERKDGVIGTWIRPEDIATYEPYIDVIEFTSENRTQEQALFRIYAEQGAWSGDLDMVIKDINYKCTNRMVPPSLAESRLNCGQRCQETGRCHLCYRLFDLANPDLLRPYLKQKSEN